MKLPYRLGYCPQCDTQIMVQDVDGKWNSFKPNFRQADMFFPDGHRVRTIICSECLKNPDFEALMTAILHEDSEACGEVSKNNLRFNIKRRTLQNDEFIHQGDVYKEMKPGENASNVVTLEGKQFKRLDDWNPIEKTPRGLPISIQKFGFSGGMKGKHLGNQ